jgi:hypothetical protein
MIDEVVYYIQKIVTKGVKPLKYIKERISVVHRGVPGDELGPYFSRS